MHKLVIIYGEVMLMIFLKKEATRTSRMSNGQRASANLM